MRPHASPQDIEELVRRAIAGDSTAWQDLVQRYSRMVWSVARAYRLGHADALDVCQFTWLRLTERLASLREPRKLPGWLTTTARNESLRLLARRQREQPWEEVPAAPPDKTESSNDTTPENTVLSAEQDRALWQAFAGLPARCRTLLQTMAFHPDLTYAQVGDRLRMPANSVGPTRSRCLASLRELLSEDSRPRTTGKPIAMSGRAGATHSEVAR
ncbi:RNA polymerase sigma factor [Actinoalloteichus hymeniacidonis]|uniref:RNA polymerase sigma factor, sigma-70 family n=1 Tax=Actinoalloteichus hymeniacidonis TaxID=340345 RepID=A0AAC9HUQ1_9PSEU|nr:sigma-70 family RNA polymerase sigma factor [Actinoalloteichus hymeniacidonis]AOS65872.1 RNA polymerase sigma factor, sigma-70 family [Actinoalloteichus hymeniacidonis]MBB5906034.1 RNA polymerase sigma factor (sigma-70 family) [Actinoalloteichus hymeniacidonis]